MNSGRERVETRGNLSRWGRILGSATLGWSVKKVKQAGKRAIDRLPSHERMALFCSSRYTLRRGILRLLWVAPVQNVARAQQCYPQRMIVFIAGTYVRVYCISFPEVHIPVTWIITHCTHFYGSPLYAIHTAEIYTFSPHTKLSFPLCARIFSLLFLLNFYSV